MKVSLRPAKISRPSSSGVFRRDRLFRVIDHSSDRPILWITGPPGSGKTSLVTSWLQARQLHSIWYQVDEGDSDPANFFYYLGLAVQRANPRRRKPLPLLTSEYLLGIPTFSRRFFENAFDRLLLISDSTSPFVIVFDNCQAIPDGSPFDKIIGAGIEHLPGGIKLIFINRKEPSEVFVRLKANSLMKTIGWDELKFTLNESNEMVRLRGHEAVSAEMLKQLHENTDGWAAGIVLSLESARIGGLESALPNVRVSKEIFKYFAGEIFERSGAAIQDFLLKTSFFPLMSSKMAEALTENHQAKGILADLNGRNYFTQKLDLETPRYQYHPLFRGFLQYLAYETLAAAAIIKIETRAAAILEEDGRPQDAIELLKKARDWPAAVQLILTHARGLAEQGRSRTLEIWIEGLPEEVVQAAPWLLYWKGMGRLPISPPESHPFFERAFSLFRAERDAVGVCLSLSGLFDSIAWSFGAYEQFDAALVLLDEVLVEIGDFPSLEIEARLLANRLFAMVFRQPWHKELKKTADRALSILPVIDDINIKVLVIRCLLLHSIYFGELHTAETLFALGRGLLRMPHISPLITLSLKNDEANYYRSIAEFPKGRKSVEEALELASTTGVHVMDVFVLGQGAVAALDSGLLEEADSFLEEMEKSLNAMPPWARNFYHHLRAWKGLVRGDFVDSLSHAETAVRIIVEAGIPHSIAHSRYVYALALNSVQKSHEAKDQLSKCQAFARKSGSLIIEFACLLAESKFAFNRGDNSCGLRSLKKALALGRTKGYLNTPYSWTPAMMADLCQKALQAGIEVDYVRHLIRKRNLMPDPPPVDCEQWPWALKIYTLGRFVIMRGEEEVRFSGKVQKRPLEMLKILISNGSGELSEEYIADCLWPDANGDMAHSSLKMTLSRVRRLLGVDGCVRFQEGKASLDPRYHWVDALAFERLIAQFEKAIGEDTTRLYRENSRPLQLAEMAVVIYKGHFLPDSEGKFWAISYRERLRSGFSRLITKTGDLLERTGQLEKACEWYRKGINIDELTEEFHQRLMICLRELGRRANAVGAYNHCKRLLSTKLGIEPSPKTKAILKTL